MSDRHDTTPGIQPVGARPVAGSGAHGYAAAGENYYTTPQYTTQPVAVRRPDILAGLLLLLAGAAAAVSLILDWLSGQDDVTGLDLVRDGLSAFGVSTGEGFSSGLWQPVFVILGGGVLALLGLLMFVPARTHRVLGLIALIVSGAVIAAVLVPLARAGWDLGEFDLGFWCALGVAGLGLLGSLKALLTGPKYGTAKTTV
jgi:hypothetical protein